MTIKTPRRAQKIVTEIERDARGKWWKRWTGHHFVVGRRGMHRHDAGVIALLHLHPALAAVRALQQQLVLGDEEDGLFQKNGSNTSVCENTSIVASQRVGYHSVGANPLVMDHRTIQNQLGEEKKVEFGIFQQEKILLLYPSVPACQTRRWLLACRWARVPDR